MNRLGTGLLAAAILALSVVHGAQAEGIDWHVEKRFRLFGAGQPPEVDMLLKKLADTHNLFDAYDDLTNLLVQRPDGPAEKIQENMPFTEFGARDDTFVPYTDDDSDTDEDPPSRYDADYLYPKFYEIVARWTDAPIDTQCVWRLAAETKSAQPCTDVVRFKLEADKKGGSSLPRQLSVSIVGSPVSPVPVSVSIRDLLIVGLGDSYASGEGNPDKPTLWQPHDMRGVSFQHQGADFYLDGPDLGRVLTHTRFEPAEWIETGCHRSLLNDQVAAAMKIAADRPHDAITFVHLACTGAQVFDGLLSPQAGMHVDAQLQALEDLLCQGQEEKGTGIRFSAPEPSRWTFEQPEAKPPHLTTCAEAKDVRPVDLVFLSIGGNDAGFAGVAAWAILPTEAPRGREWQQLTTKLAIQHIGVICPQKDPSVYRVLGKNDDSVNDVRCDHVHYAEAYIAQLPSIYNSLSQAFEAMGISNGAIIHMGYPDPSWKAPMPANLGAPGKLPRPVNQTAAKKIEIRNECPGNALLQYSYTWRGAGMEMYTPGLNGFKGLFKLIGSSKNRRLVIDYDKSYRIEVSVIQNLQTQILAADRSHHWIDTQDPESTLIWADIRDHHGWCATAALDAEAQKVELWTPAWTDDEHADLSPLTYTPYDKTTVRYFRTPNDSIMTENRNWKDNIAGTMHPTYSAHLLMANILVSKADSVLGGGN